MIASETTSQRLRTCFREPITEIRDAAQLLNTAVSAHLAGHTAEAEQLIRLTDMPAIRDWIESIIGKNSQYIFVRTGREPSVSLSERVPARMPTALEKRQLHERDGYHCRFCGIPVVRKEIRERIRRRYPNALPWGKRNAERHAAFFAMWVQYDHLIPHAKGGTNSLDNVVVTCAACNYGRRGYTLAEVGLRNPFERPSLPSSWDGLERIVRAPSNNSFKPKLFGSLPYFED